MLWTECLWYPQIHVLKSNRQCDSIRKWCFWELIRSWGWSPSEWVYYPFFIKENPQSSLAPSTTWAYREKMDAYEPGSRPLQTPDLWTSWSWTSRLQKSEKYVSVAYKPQSMVFCYHCPNGLRQLDCLEAEIEAEIWCLWFWGRACQEKPLRIVKGKLLSKAMISRQV